MLVAVALIVAMIGPAGVSVGPEPQSVCSPNERREGGCFDTDNEGDHLDIGGEREREGQNPAPPESNYPSPGYPAPNPGDPGEPEREIILPDCDWGESDNYLVNPDHCWADERPEELPEDEIPVIPPITEYDVISFAPVPPTVNTEPAGVALVGAPMNVFAPATAHTSSGMLFDLPVSVTFTPVAYHFDFGDGTVISANSGGESWSALELPDFSATETSHAYAERGSHTLVTSVDFTAIVDFGVWGLREVPGVVTVSSPGATIRVVESNTVLTKNTCNETPTAPGC